MKRIFFILTLILLIGLSNCTRKYVVTCGVGDLESRPNIVSKIVRLERIAIADTTITFVAGDILGKDSSEAGVVIDTLMAALVVFTDKATNKMYGSQTDLQGKYYCYLPASTYDIKVQYIAYNTLVLRNVILGAGDVVQFNAMLGQAGMRDQNAVYEMQADKTIKIINQSGDTNK